MKKNLSFWFRLSAFFLFIAGLLSACSLQAAPDKAPVATPVQTTLSAPIKTPVSNAITQSQSEKFLFIPLLLAILLLVAFTGLLYYFYSKKQLQAWISEGLNLTRSRFEQAKFKTKRKQFEADQVGLFKELGRKAWEARISDPSYSEEYSKLETMQARLSAMEEVVKNIQLELAKARDGRNKLTAAYNQKQQELQSQLTQMNDNLMRLRSEHKAALDGLRQAENKRQSLIAESKGYENKIAEIQASETPDKDVHISSLNNSIATLEKTVNALAEQIDGFNNQAAKLNADQGPYLTQIDSLKAQINLASNEYKDALMPMDQQVSNLDANLKARQAEMAALKAEMEPVVYALGPRVDAARPESEALKELYQKLDVKKEQLQSTSASLDLANNRVLSRDKDSVRNFFLLILATILVLAAVIYLLVLAF